MYMEKSLVAFYVSFQVADSPRHHLAPGYAGPPHTFTVCVTLRVINTPGVCCVLGRAAGQRASHGLAVMHTYVPPGLHRQHLERSGRGWEVSYVQD